jgi:hypothetical protein
MLPQEVNTNLGSRANTNESLLTLLKKHKAKQTNWVMRREVLCNILISFGVPMKLYRVNKMCFNEKYGKVRIGKYLVRFLSKMV